MKVKTISKMSSTNRKVAIVTGTNSNLGVNICYRLIEKLKPDTRLTLVVTSRTLPRAKEVVEVIKHHISTMDQKKIPSVDFDYILVDFTDMVSVLGAFYDLVKRYTAIHYFFANAAQGTYDGINWMGAVRQLVSDPLEAVTTPNYRLQKTGILSKDEMGLVFQANVFGPYYLIQKLKPLLIAGKAKVIWVSSLMSDPKFLSLNDMQLIKSDISYEGSKRLIDLLHLGTYKQLREDNVFQYVVQPGIFTSKSMDQYLNVVTFYGMLFLFYFARYLGSNWHTIDGYKAANAPIHAAMLSTEYAEDQRLKFGSATYKDGYEYIKSQEMDSTGAIEVATYLKTLEKEWDDKLKDHITNTRKPI